jgi:3'-5' exoribonuclease
MEGIRTDMKYIETLREGERINEIYLCKTKQSALTKAGKPYENVVLQDKTGTLDAKIWDPGSAGIDEFDALDYVAVTGDVTCFQGNLQLSIKRARKASEGEFEPKDYLPVSSRDIDEMYNELLAIISSIGNRHLKKLLESFFVADEDFRRRFKFHSAAKTVHHGFVGGLLEHTLGVAKHCEYFASAYPMLNRDLLVTAAIFHDIGKLDELSVFPENDYTDEGQLLGHIIIGTEVIGARIREIEGFPKTLANELKHCILAHHGELEFGSPKKPAIAEALALSMADNFDAKMETFKEIFANVPDGNIEWQGYNRLLESNIRQSSKE